jgi:hypothetical protein
MNAIRLATIAAVLVLLSRTEYVAAEEPVRPKKARVAELYESWKKSPDTETNEVPR